MNTIELMLDALNDILPILEGDQYKTTKAAIAVGEQELKREPVAWRSWYIDSNNYVIWQQKPSSTTFMLEPLYTREETK